jgi:hypothetical protein
LGKPPFHNIKEGDSGEGIGQLIVNQLPISTHIQYAEGELPFMKKTLGEAKFNLFFNFCMNVQTIVYHY